MFEIHEEQLLRLSDAELRELVARLCQAELSRRGAPVSAVRWGGSQAAPDGGLDVEVLIKGQKFDGDFVPCAWTGIQVKKSSMPAHEIANEMSPRGILRPILPKLARHDGCYIIVSMADDPAGIHLGDREKAMQDQIESIRDQGDLRLEFYGRARLTDWLRQCPAVQLWVREKLALPLSGWRPFGRWSTTPPGVEDDLICKGGIAISLPGRMGKLGIVEGVNGIRELVRNTEKAVRVVGLSGVGKSRIVQALFEESVGSKPLDSHLAIYADLGEAPNPSAKDVVERLTAEGLPATLVLDNCPSDTHSRVANQVASSSGIQLVTIEFDIREDKPETTSVVRIDAEGPEITEGLVRRRYPSLGQVNARRIAEFSGGNARLALALADVVTETKESLSSFSDAQLFDRLFYQRGVPDPDLIEAAEVLALVYSFSIGDSENGVDELAMLAGLLGRHWDRRALHRAAQTLVDRQLAQKRGNWRAVLPHAVANRLAACALQNIPVHDILSTFQNPQNPRLLKSFGKRLGYLHDHEIAQGIVRSWLSPEGLLHNLGQLNDENIELLGNVAPAAPGDVLGAIEAQDETFFSKDNPKLPTFAELLVMIAYDADLFERCVNILARFALTERDGENWNSVRDRLFGLFALYFSGTEAGPGARENIVRSFLLSDEPDGHQLGLGMLKAALQGRNVFSSATLEFGARPRSYGYQPATFEEQDQWFTRFIRLAQEVATDSNVNLASSVRRLLAAGLRDLWHDPGLRVALVNCAKVLSGRRPWLEGWQAVREIKHYDYHGTEDEPTLDGIDLLDELDEMLKPNRLSDEVRVYILGEKHQVLTLDEEFDSGIHEQWEEANGRAATRAYDLGRAVAGDLRLMGGFSHEFFTAAPGYLIEFGEGMASACGDLHGLWDQLVEGLEHAGDQAWNGAILVGVLRVIHQREEHLAQQLLDETVQNHLLRRFIVTLQLSVSTRSEGVDRLRKALDFEDTPLRQYGSVVWHHPFDGFEAADIRDLMLTLLGKPEGAAIVLEGLSMRLTLLKHEYPDLEADLKKVGLLLFVVLLRQDARFNDVTDHRMAKVLASCMDEAEFPQETGEIIDAFLERMRTSFGLVGGLRKTVAVLAEKAPFQFLDGVFFAPALQHIHQRGVFREWHDERNSLSGVSVEVLLDWCRQGDFQHRLMLLSKAVCPFSRESDGGAITVSEQVLRILEASGEPSTILRNLQTLVQSRGRSGSLAVALAEQRRAFEALMGHSRPAVRVAAAAKVAEMKRREEEMRAFEQKIDGQGDQRFEW